MATVRAMCPHCAQYDRLSVSIPIENVEVSKRRPWLLKAKIGAFSRDVVAPLHCHTCGGWSIGVFSANASEGSQVLKTGETINLGIEGTGVVELLSIFPNVENFVAPELVPKNARDFFIEASEDLRAGRSPAGIIGKCRSVLDVCLKDLNAEGQTRKTKISNLKTKGILTTGIADWANKLWDDGNDAIHDLTGDMKEARQHILFLELFFEVTYAIPNQVATAQIET